MSLNSLYVPDHAVRIRVFVDHVLKEHMILLRNLLHYWRYLPFRLASILKHYMSILFCGGGFSTPRLRCPWLRIGRWTIRSLLILDLRGLQDRLCVTERLNPLRWVCDFLVDRYYRTIINHDRALINLLSCPFLHKLHYNILTRICGAQNMEQ